MSVQTLGKRKLTGVRSFLPLALLFGCQSAPIADEPKMSPAVERDTTAIEGMLDELYRAFCFDAGGEADWEAMRELFADGASFVAPIAPGQTPRAVQAHEFISDFRSSIKNSPLAQSGFHERITKKRIDYFGTVAHVYVTFEGFVPGEDSVRTRGVDSVQLVRDGQRWLLASFTTQYEGPLDALPLRFQ